MAGLKKPRVWQCDTWNFTFIFYVGWSFADFRSDAMRRYRTTAEIVDLGIGRRGMTIFQSSQCRAAIWVLQKRDVATLAHEAIHAAHIALDIAGVQPDFDNDEAVTYLVDAIMRKAMAK